MYIYFLLLLFLLFLCFSFYISMKRKEPLSFKTSMDILVMYISNIFNY